MHEDPGGKIDDGSTVIDFNRPERYALTALTQVYEQSCDWGVQNEWLIEVRLSIDRLNKTKPSMPKQTGPLILSGRRPFTRFSFTHGVFGNQG